MQYNINNLSSSDFEILTQSLCKKILGNGTVCFGEGPDGGREITYDGTADYPSKANRWSGYWVAQAKYKSIRSKQDSRDFTWLKGEMDKELKKYKTRKIKVKKPDNLLIFSNIIITPTAKVGGRDKINDFINKAKITYKIKNIAVIANDDIVDFLNNNRDVAVAFSGFILPGDILSSLYTLLDKNQREKTRINKFIGLYLEAEFRNNLASKLEHAGKLTDEKISLSKLFIDLYATNDGNIPSANS